MVLLFYVQVAVYRIDWEKEVLRAKELVAAQGEQQTFEVHDHCAQQGNNLAEPLLMLSSAP